MTLPLDPDAIRAKIAHDAPQKKHLRRLYLDALKAEVVEAIAELPEPSLCTHVVPWHGCWACMVGLVWHAARAACERE